MNKLEWKLLKVWTVKKISWTYFYEVSSEFVFEINYHWKLYNVEINKYFKTDFWSIPKLFHSFLNKNWWNSYILHDYLYLLWWFCVEDSHEYIQVTRKEADKLLDTSLKNEWASFLERLIIRTWLFLWWFIAWNKYRDTIDSNFKYFIRSLLRKSFEENEKERKEWK